MEIDQIQSGTSSNHVPFPNVSAVCLFLLITDRLFGRTKAESNQMRLLGGDVAEDEEHRIVIVKAKPYRDSTEMQKL